MTCPDCSQAVLNDTSARASEHRERARKLRELANVAPSRSEQAQLNARAEMFDAFARLAAHGRMKRYGGGLPINCLITK